jgi:ABC-type transport system substrate-binding protein
MYRIKVSTQTTDYVAYQNRDLDRETFAAIAGGTWVAADSEVYAWGLEFAGPFFYNAVWNEHTGDWCNTLPDDQVDAAMIAWDRNNLP